MKIRALDNSKIYNTRKQILFFVGIYILTNLIIIFFIRYAYCDWHSNNYFRMMDSYSQEYIEDGTVSRGMRDKLYLYDLSGNLVYETGNSNYSMMTNDPAEKGREYIKDAILGKRVSRYIWITGKANTYTSMVYYCAPAYDKDEIKYAAVLVKETPDALEVTIGFLFIVTVFYIILAVTSLSYTSRLRKYDKLQKQYIDNITHELKSPVASIKALAQALSDGKTAANLDNNIYYGRIMVEADKQERLIAALLELSKIQTGTAVFNIEKVDAEPIFEYICENYSGRCDLLGLDFEVGSDIKELKTLYTDATYFQQLLDIFLSNAVKYCKENGTVKLDALIGKRKATICISDNGIGISKDELNNILDRFYRGKNAKAFAGNGLGLAIANEIINSLNEKMWIESEENKGTKVFFTVSL